MSDMFVYLIPSFWTTSTPRDWIDIVNALGPTLTGGLTAWFAWRIGTRQVDSMEKTRKHEQLMHRYIENRKKVMRSSCLLFESTTAGSVNSEMQTSLYQAFGEAKSFLKPEIVEYIDSFLKLVQKMYAHQSCLDSTQSEPDQQQIHKKALKSCEDDYWVKYTPHYVNILYDKYIQGLL